MKETKMKKARPKQDCADAGYRVDGRKLTATRRLPATEEADAAQSDDDRACRCPWALLRAREQRNGMEMQEKEDGAEEADI